MEAPRKREKAFAEKCRRDKRQVGLIQSKGLIVTWRRRVSSRALGFGNNDRGPMIIMTLRWLHTNMLPSVGASKGASKRTVSYLGNHELQGLLDKSFSRADSPTEAEGRDEERRVGLVILSIQPPLRYALIGVFEIRLVQPGYPRVQQHHCLCEHTIFWFFLIFFSFPCAIAMRKKGREGLFAPGFNRMTENLRLP
jgi:hypothetical protein